MKFEWSEVFPTECVGQDWLPIGPLTKPKIKPRVPNCLFDFQILGNKFIILNKSIATTYHSAPHPSNTYYSLPRLKAKRNRAVVVEIILEGCGYRLKKGVYLTFHLTVGYYFVDRERTYITE